MGKLNILGLYAANVAWASDRNLIKGATPIAQFLKLDSEKGELADAILKGDTEGQIDGIGDSFVVLSILSKQVGHEAIESVLERVDKKETGRYSGQCNDDPHPQIAHLILSSHIGELAFALVHGSHVGACDAIDRSLFSLERLAASLGHSLEDCAQYAYDEIKDRKGVMYNGAFIKSTDPLYEGIVAQLNAAPAQ